MGFEAVTEQPFYFVSYNRDDLKPVAKIARALHQEKGVPLFYDRGIAYSEEWKKMLGTKISESESVILFLTMALLQKQDSFVPLEYDIATNLNKRVNVILLEKINPKNVPAENQMFYAELMKLNVIEAYALDSETLKNEICRALQFQPSEKQAVRTARERSQPTKPKPTEKKKSDSFFRRFINEFRAWLKSREWRTLLYFGFCLAIIMIVVFVTTRLDPDSFTEFSSKNASAIAVSLEKEVPMAVKKLQFKDCNGEFSEIRPYLDKYEVLIFQDCQFSDGLHFSDFAGLENLLELWIINCELKDDASIGRLDNLKKLVISKNPLGSVNGLSQLIGLESVELSGDELTDISGLQNCTALKEIRLQNNQITDFSVCKKNANTLEKVVISNNHAELDLSMFQGFGNLRSLDISGNSVPSLRPLSDVKTLTALSADDCALSKFDIYFSDVDRFEFLSLRHNKLKELLDFPYQVDAKIMYLFLSDNLFSDSVFFNASSIKVYDVRDNQIPSLHFSAANAKVYVYGNPILFASSLHEFTSDLSDSKIYLSYHDEMEVDTIPTDAAAYYLVDFPLDQIVPAKQMFGDEKVIECSRAEADKAAQTAYKTAYSLYF